MWQSGVVRFTIDDMRQWEFSSPPPSTEAKGPFSRGSNMKNVQMTVAGNILMITVDLTKVSLTVRVREEDHHRLD
jgi:hypothetical protein